MLQGRKRYKMEVTKEIIREKNKRLWERRSENRVIQQYIIIKWQNTKVKIHSNIIYVTSIGKQTTISYILYTLIS